MTDRTIFRLTDICQAIEEIDALLENSDFASVNGDRVKRAAFERFLEILSEASRHVPDEMKIEEPQIPWSRVADIGNHLRHTYHKVDFEILWNTWQSGELASLHDAVQRMIGKISATE